MEFSSPKKLNDPHFPATSGVPEDEAESMQLTIPLIDPLHAKLGERLLEAKIMALKVLNRTEVKTTIWRKWESYPTLHIMVARINNYVFTFQTRSEVEAVMKKGPWFVISFLMSIQEWGDAKTIKGGHEQKLCCRPTVMASSNKTQSKYGLFLSVPNLESLEASVNERAMYQLPKSIHTELPKQQPQLGSDYLDEDHMVAMEESQDSSRGNILSDFTTSKLDYHIFVMNDEGNLLPSSP